MMQLTTKRIVVFTFVMATSWCALSASADEPSTTDANAVQADEDEIVSWVAGLASTQYRYRELCSRRLLAVGVKAIPALESGLADGDLETTSRIITVLRMLSTAFEPEVGSVDPAWEALTKISTSGSSSAASRAQLALGEVRDDRTNRAYQALTSAGVFVGFGQYHLASSVMTDEYHLRIPEDWDGDEKTLFWLSWMHGVETVVLAGERINLQVLRRVAAMPDLKNLVIRDTELTAKDLEGLTGVARFEQFQLVNVPAGDELIDAIVALRIRRTLTLFGTMISPQGQERLADAFPNLTIQCRGGFLGVHCNAFSPNCEVREVREDSGALEAGVQPKDIITRFGEYDVTTFADLQAAISKHPADTPIPMQVIRVVDEEVKPDPSEIKDGDVPAPRIVRRPKTITLMVKLKRDFP